MLRIKVFVCWFLGSACCCCFFDVVFFCGDDFIAVAVVAAVVVNFECPDIFALATGADVVAVHASFVNLVSAVAETAVVASDVVLR